MLKNLAGLECKIEERTINLTCDQDCPITHIKEALFQFLKHIGQIEDNIKAQTDAQKALESACSIEELPVTDEVPKSE